MLYHPHRVQHKINSTTHNNTLSHTTNKINNANNNNYVSNTTKNIILYNALYHKHNTDSIQHKNFSEQSKAYPTYKLKPLFPNSFIFLFIIIIFITSIAIYKVNKANKNKY